MTITQSQIDQLLTLVRQTYPHWQNFNYPSFVAEQIDAPQTAAGLMRTQLARTEFERLLRQNLFDEIVNRLEQVAHATKLLESADLRILSAATVNRGELCRQLFNLLYGNAAIEVRLQHYLDFVNQQSSDLNTWAFPTYFLFLVHPDREMFVSPALTERYLTWFGVADGWSPQPSVAAYVKLVAFVQQLQRALKPYAPHDLIDLQGLLQVAFHQEPQYWKIAPGENAWQWSDCLEGGFIAIGWDELGDLTALNQNEFAAQRDALIAQKAGWSKAGTNQVWEFAKRIREGDRIVANHGTTEVLGIGTVTGPYYFVPNVRHGHRLPVEWDDTTVRKVNQGGWRKTLIPLDRATFEAVSAIQPVAPAFTPVPSVNSDCPFSQITFDLLAQLHADPTVALYTAHKADFAQHIEDPFKRVLLEAGRRLPAALREVMETEKRIFARFTKNDWGQGGAWDFYWGAFYPKGSKRSQDAQLSMWMNYRYLEFGFYIGDYGSEQRLRFQRNCERNAGPLSEIMSNLFRPGEIILGARDEFTVAPDGTVTDSVQRTWADFIRNPTAANCDASVVIPAPELLTLTFEALVQRIVHAHQRLFPLVLAALEEEPMSAIRTYLQPLLEDNEDEDEGPEQPTIIEPPAPYTAENFLHETYLRPEALSDLLDLLADKQQLILHGPPGTGKTFVAERLAKLLTGLAQPGPRQMTIQFHPAYGYEDFIEGIRPESKTTITGQQVVEYPVLAGRFREFCERAARHDPDVAHVFIIDEINRGNIPRIFGELLYLLEYRGESVTLPYSGKPFQIPPNVYVIGTMNTADRSIALVDFALRRRFNFVPLLADPDLFDRWLAANPLPVPYLGALYRRLCSEAITDPNYRIGPSYFMQPGLTEAKLARIWRYSIEPLLQEYYAENEKKAALWAWTGELLQSVRDGG